MTRPSLLRLTFALAVSACATIVSAQSLIHGRVVAVADGDTITVLDAQHVQHRVRLAGIDAPEASQAFGRVAKSNLSRLVFQHEVDVQVTKTDRYGRLVGKVTAGGQDVCLEQLRAGLAWFYTDYQFELSAADRTAYAAAAREAESSRRGLWADSHRMPPWQFRRNQRNGGMASPPSGNGSGSASSSAATARAASSASATVVGNRNSGIYHLPDCPDFAKISAKNRVYFPSETAAVAAGFRKARNCP